jgi:hypothetical protein
VGSGHKNTGQRAPLLRQAQEVAQRARRRRAAQCWQCSVAVLLAGIALIITCAQGVISDSNAPADVNWPLALATPTSPPTTRPLPSRRSLQVEPNFDPDPPHSHFNAEPHTRAHTHADSDADPGRQPAR